jgi:hypothetical protein
VRPNPAPPSWRSGRPLPPPSPNQVWPPRRAPGPRPREGAAPQGRRRGPPRMRPRGRGGPVAASAPSGTQAGAGVRPSVRTASTCAHRAARGAAWNGGAPGSFGSLRPRVARRCDAPRRLGRAQPVRNDVSRSQVSQCSPHMHARRAWSAFVSGLRPPGLAARPHHRELCAQGYHFVRLLATADDQARAPRSFAWATSVDSSHACAAPAGRAARAPHRVLRTRWANSPCG